jgi:pimeloyl-ACP methyl ester carboxylesterase
MHAHAAARDRGRAHAEPQAEARDVNWKAVEAVFRKDARSLRPLLSLAALLFCADAVIVRADLLPVWSEYNLPVLIVGLLVVVLSVFQQDSPASLVDDWLCRPLGRLELVGAKLLMVLVVVYVPRFVGTLATDLALGLPLTESLLDALLLQESVLVMLLPILVFTALITRTFVQGFGVLFAVFIAAFVIPTPFVRPPGPLTPGLREALFVSGLQWLATTPALVASTLLVIVGAWLAYGRRRLGAARGLFGGAIGVVLLCFLMPMALLPWSRVFALQRVSSAAPGPEAADVAVRATQACFPATRRASLGSDVAFAGVSRSLGDWSEEELRTIGSDSVAFITAVEPRGLPLDWRAQLEFVSAQYTVDGRAPITLRPAKYFTEAGNGATLRHAWLLPVERLHKLQARQPELRLTYSLALLRPREHRLATDGARRHLPGLGFCGAKLDEAGNRILVDCFTAAAQPAQITAALNDIPATRAGSAVDFSPRWTQWLYGKRVKLAVSPARLAEHDTITITAWQLAGHVEKSVDLAGILGGDDQTCPLPGPGTASNQASNWRDLAPHQVHSVTVDAGVQLEVLDFGGRGPPLVLLPGLGATAHSFDEFAPPLTAHYRVIALTRRGAGASSRPETGFDTPRLAQDVLAVIDHLKLGTVLLVGHSIAGEELTWLGGHHADRFAGLVYLDAAYNRSGDGHDERSRRLRELHRRLPAEPPIPPSAMVDAAALNRYLVARGHVRMPEGELIAFFNMGAPFLAGTPNIDARSAQAIQAAARRPDYARIRIPALAVYAFENADRDSSPERVEIRRLEDALRRENLAAFRRGAAHAEVLALENASHYVIQSNPQQLIEKIIHLPWVTRAPAAAP